MEYTRNRRRLRVHSTKQSTRDTAANCRVGFVDENQGHSVAAYSVAVCMYVYVWAGATLPLLLLLRCGRGTRSPYSTI